MYTIGVIIVLYFYVRLGMWVARKTASRCERKGAKWVVRIVVALVFFLIPAGDEIAGRIYFNHLCATETGVRVYQTIELPEEYWNEDGSPKFFDENNGNFSLPLEKFAETDSKSKSRSFGIEERRSILLSKATHKPISEDVLFRYWGGWISKSLSPQNTATHCGGDYKDFVENQFKQTTADGE